MLVGPVWAIMRQAPGARAKLLDAAEGSDPVVAAAAIETLRYAGATSDEIRDRLLAIAQGGDDAKALLAARALAHGRAEPAQVIPVILDQVQGQRQNRAAFLDPLALYDEELLPYLPQLFDLFTDTDPGVRAAAIRLTVELHQRINIPLATSRAWPAIAALRNDPDPKVAAAALEAVGEGEASMPDR
jgi:hypothetical protein